MWLQDVALSEGCEISDLNYIFCSDEYLLKVNIEYLSHDFYTDIITFDNSDLPQLLEGDIFISIERVLENSQHQQTTFFPELLRVIVHGTLHLIGYDDKDDHSQQVMRSMENKCLDLYFREFDNDI